MRKQFATSLDTDITENFRQSCEAYGLKMNLVLECLMKDFSNGNYTIELKKDGMSIKKVE